MNDWENVLCNYIEDNESYYDCLKRLVEEHGTQRDAAAVLGINHRRISNLFYDTKNGTAGKSTAKETFNHTDKFINDTHKWLIDHDVSITKKALLEFLKSGEGQKFLRARLLLLERGRVV